MSHDDTDFNFVFTSTADLNITGITSIQAGAVDVDFDVGTFTQLNVDGGQLAVQSGNLIRVLSSDNTDWVDFSHDLTDFNIAATATTDLNITGFTGIAAGTVDADFDAVTATSFGLDDNENLLLGTGQDVEIFWTGASAHIDIMPSTGNFIVQGNVTASAELMINAALNGAVTMYYNGVEKFSSALGGLKVDGGIYMDEMASAGTDATGDGQWWVLNEAVQLPMFTAEDGVDQIIDPSMSEINTQNGNYTLLIGDKGKTIHKASGGAGETITIPANASVAYRIGTLIGFQNDGGGDLSIAITTDTMTGTDGTTGTQTLGDNHTAVVQKMTATTWKYAASDM